jgi:hypothetical protein
MNLIQNVCLIALICIGVGISAGCIIHSLRQKFWHDEENDCWWPDPKNSKGSQYIIHGKKWQELRIRYLPSEVPKSDFSKIILDAVIAGKRSIVYPALPDITSEEFQERMNRAIGVPNKA